MSGVMLAAAASKTLSLSASIGNGASSSGSTAAFSWGAAATVMGGSGSYSYAWQFVFHDSYTWSLSPTNGASTTVTVQLVAHGDLADAQVQCVVTDLVTGKTATSNAANFLYSRS